MPLIVWLLTGLVAGIAASKIATRRDDRVAPELVFGLAGSIVGGLIVLFLS